MTVSRNSSSFQSAILWIQTLNPIAIIKKTWAGQSSKTESRSQWTTRSCYLIWDKLRPSRTPWLVTIIFSCINCVGLGVFVQVNMDSKKLTSLFRHLYYAKYCGLSAWLEILEILSRTSEGHSFKSENPFRKMFWKINRFPSGATWRLRIECDSNVCTAANLL